MDGLELCAGNAPSALALCATCVLIFLLLPLRLAPCNRPCLSYFSAFPPSLLPLTSPLPTATLLSDLGQPEKARQLYERALAG